jgi:hypothetical protein
MLEKYTKSAITIILIIKIGIIMKKAILLILIASFATTAYSHGGRTDKNGCHKETKTGERHCH